MSTEVTDQSRSDEFVNRAMGDLASAMSVVLCILGDRLGLFSALAQAGPATSDQLAQRAGVAERYA